MNQDNEYLPNKSCVITSLDSDDESYDVYPNEEEAINASLPYLDARNAKPIIYNYNFKTREITEVKDEGTIKLIKSFQEKEEQQKINVENVPQKELTYSTLYRNMIKEYNALDKRLNKATEDLETKEMSNSMFKIKIEEMLDLQEQRRMANMRCYRFLKKIYNKST